MTAPMPPGPPSGPPSGPPPGMPPGGPPGGPPRGPSGPPPGGYGYGYNAAAPPPPPSSGSQRGLIIGVAIGVVVLLIAVTVGVVLLTGDEAEAGEIFLDPTTDVGRDPFSDSVADPSVRAITGQSTTGTSAGGTVEVTSAAGSEPGLYGGTQNQAQCDRRRLIDFLVANPEKGRAWAGVQGINVSQIEDYILDLTSMQLRADTRVTNHGFRNGRATEYQTVLQAGTAVLVDRQGIPRARCACGNPLTPPRAVSSSPRFRGTRWTGFTPSNLQVVVIQQTINIFVIIDIDTGDPFTRPPGTNGDDDEPYDENPPTTTPGTTPPETTPPDDFGGANDVDITLSWSGNDDLDLHVIEPGGEELSFSSPTTSTGGNLVGGDNIPACEDTGGHTENGYWGAGAATPGEYQVFVHDFGACDEDGASYTLDISVNGQSVGGDSGTLTPGTDSGTVTITVPD